LRIFPRKRERRENGENERERERERADRLGFTETSRQKLIKETGELMKRNLFVYSCDVLVERK